MTWAIHTSLAYSPHPLGAAKPGEKGGKSHGSMHLPAPTQSSHHGLQKTQIEFACSQTGLLQNSPCQPVCQRIFFRPVIFQSTQNLGGQSKKHGKAAQGSSPCSGGGELAPASPRAGSGGRRNTSVWTTGTHLGGDFSQGLQSGYFL